MTVSPQELESATRCAVSVVLRWASRVPRSGAFDLEDVKQVARVEVWRSASRYERGRGTSFPSWAARAALGAVKRLFRDRDKVTRSAYEARCRGEEVGYEGLPPVPFSVLTIGEQGKIALEDHLLDPHTWEAEDRRILLKDLLTDLPPRERLILQLYYWRDWTESRIGRRLGYSQMHIHRLRVRALTTLRGAMEE